MGRLNDALAAYEAGLKHEPGLAMLTTGLAEVKAEMEAERDGGMGGLGNVFSQPDVLQKIASNPQTAGFLADPSFVDKLRELAAKPGAIGNHLQDQRILTVMGMLMGVNIQTADPPRASTKQAKPEPKPEPLTPEQEAAKAVKDEADAHKLKGNAAYKAKQFDEAIKHYEAAIAVLPNEVRMRGPVRVPHVAVPSCDLGVL
jgi:stress-induced-phosphoprotein 1